MAFWDILDYMHGMLTARARRPIPPPSPRIEIVLGDGSVPVALKRVSHSQRFTLRVRAATRDVVLSMPAYSSLRSAREFAERNADWIQARLATLPRPVSFEPRSVVPLRGVEHHIVHRPETRGVVWTEYPASGPQICVAGERPHVSRRVADFLKREAKKDLEAAVRKHTRRIEVVAQRIVLRDTKSRWGSCSSAGTLNFSWRLVMAPAYVLDYLAAHEVAHIVHMDHSPQFWKVTHKLCARTDEAEAWLKTKGADLHRFGAAKRL